MTKTHVVKWLFRMILLCLMLSGIPVETKAASYPTSYSAESLALRTSDTSVVGVNFYFDDQLEYYTHDVWHDDGSGWYYDHTNLNGKVGAVTETSYNPNAIWLLNPASNNQRFNIMLSNITIKHGSYENYTVVIEHHYNNRLIKRIIETPFDSMDSYDKSLSLMYRYRSNVNTCPVLGYEATYASYRYKLYKILNIGVGGDIPAASGGWTVSGSGQAYYNGDNYIIRSLPSVTPNMAGYVCRFDGWYSSLEGGTKYEVGSTIQKGSTIYPHWTKTPIQYQVKCIDVLGKDSTGLKIGESTWMQDYDSVAAGSHQGCLPLESTYYEGMVYAGCSQKVVGLSDNVVYRYFDYATYPVQIIDRIVTGPKAGTDLQTTSRQVSYKSSASGSLLGSNGAVGAYYQGYYYQQSTSATVGVKGATVYRYFAPIQYNISFDGNGATSGSMAAINDCWYDQEYRLIANDYQKAINISLDLQAENAVCDSQGKKVFLQWKGWSDSKNGKVRYSNQDYVKNLRATSGTGILYAVWGPSEVTISAVPRRMGYVFAGWSEDPDAESGDTEFSLEKDTTLYAVWKPDIMQYHVEYYKEDQEGNFQMTTQYAYSDYTGNAISIEDTVPDYQGFYLDRGSSTLEGTVKEDGSLVLMAYYRRNTYQVIFDELSVESTGDGENILKGVFEQEVQIPDYQPHKKGYLFAGWTADPGSTQVYVMNGDTYRIPNHDQTLYAIWQPEPYTVRFQANVPASEQDAIKGHMPELTGYYEEDLIMPECSYRRTGYRFVSWNTSADGTGTSYQAQEQIPSLYQEKDKSIQLYAIWAALEGEIQYQMNIPEHSSSLGMGEMKATPYRYDGQWSLEKCCFVLPGYDFDGWNTCADGTGDFYQDQEEMCRKMPVAGVQKLYAVWKPRSDTKFYLQLEKSMASTEETEREILELEGKTDSTLSAAVIAYYQSQGMSTTIQDFVTGFTVMNPDALEENTVNASGQTMVSLQLERKKYQVQIVRDLSDPDSECYFTEETLYEDDYIFSESIEGIGNVKAYIGQDGNRYFPGDGIPITDHCSFMAEHTVTYHMEEDQEIYVSHDMPVTLKKPEEKGHYFQGWYLDEMYRDFAGNADDVLYFKEDRELYAKWSEEKIPYQIQYDMGNLQEAAFLEDPIGQYYYGEKTLLPIAAQLLIPAEYEFVGWYDKQDADKTIITMIPQTEYGNKVYCLQLKKKNKQETGNKDPDENQEKPEEDSGNTGLIPDDAGEFSGSSSDPVMDISGDPISDLENSHLQNSSDAASQNQMGTLSDQNNSEWITKAVSPIHSTKGNAAKASFVTFTKGKITYRCNKAGGKTVQVVCADPKIKKASIPSHVSWKGVRYSVTRIGSKAFSGCRRMKKITIGKQVKQIGKKAFSGCKNLKTVIFQGKQIRKIQKKAFVKTGNSLRFTIPEKSQKRYVRLLKKSGMQKIHSRK